MEGIVWGSTLFLGAIFVMVSIAARRAIPHAWVSFSLATGAALSLWFGVVFTVGKTGFFATNPLFAPMLVFGFLVLLFLLRKVYESKKIQAIALSVPLPWIVGIQTYRIVGVIFFSYYTAGLLPGIFAFPAGIGDVIVGATAPFVAYALWSGIRNATRIAMVWNTVGIVDLVIALLIGALTFPRPVQFFPSDISTEQLALFPLVLVPLFAVPLGLILHLYTLQILRRTKENTM